MSKQYRSILSDTLAYYAKIEKARKMSEVVEISAQARTEIMSDIRKALAAGSLRVEAALELASMVGEVSAIEFRRISELALDK
jgi:hypothetical protein